MNQEKMYKWKDFFKVYNKLMSQTRNNKNSQTVDSEVIILKLTAALFKNKVILGKVNFTLG